MVNVTNKSCIFNTISNYGGISDTQIFMSVTFFLFGFSSIFGNILIIVSLCRGKLLNYGGYYTLIHYAITDMITGLLDLIYMPLATLLSSGFKLSFILGFVLAFGEYSRKMFIAFMALTKFFSILFPLKARTIMHLQWYKKTTVITWILSIIISVPLWFQKSFYFDSCTYHWAFNEETLLFTSCYGIFINVTVTVIIVITYPLCFFKICKSTSTWNNISSGCRRQSLNLQTSRTESKILCLFVLNSFIFVLYWLPVYLFELWNVHIPNYALFQECMRGILISYNPVVYVLLNSNIRRAVKNCITCKSAKKISKENDCRSYRRCSPQSVTFDLTKF